MTSKTIKGVIGILASAFVLTAAVLGTVLDYSEWYAITILISCMYLISTFVFEDYEFYPTEANSMWVFSIKLAFTLGMTAVLIIGQKPYLTMIWILLTLDIIKQQRRKM